MKVDTIKAAFTYTFAFVVFGAAYYGLVLFPFELDDLVKGALIGFAGSAIAFVFGQEIAKQTAATSQRAFDKGLSTPMTTTITSEPPATTVTTGPVEP